MGLVRPVYAEKPIAVVHGTFESTNIQYYGQDPNSYIGPNLYYGKAVLLCYTITITWTSKTYSNDEVLKTLSYVGTVDIYDATDLNNLIFLETRSCQGSLSFYGKRGDASFEVDQPDGFYNVDWDSVDEGNMEKLTHISKIQGVLIRMVHVQNEEGMGKVITLTHPPIVIVVNDYSNIS